MFRQICEMIVCCTNILINTICICLRICTLVLNQSLECDLYKCFFVGSWLENKILASHYRLNYWHVEQKILLEKQEKWMFSFKQKRKPIITIGMWQFIWNQLKLFDKNPSDLTTPRHRHNLSMKISNSDSYVQTDLWNDCVLYQYLNHYNLYLFVYLSVAENTS
jgi:hypothetical protein